MQTIFTSPLLHCSVVARLTGLTRSCRLASLRRCIACFAVALLSLLSATHTFASFANGAGRAIVPGDGLGWSIALQPSDGKILVGGPCNGNTFCVARLNSDGSLDTSFNAPGNATPGRIALTALKQSAYNTKSKLIVRGDGKIVFGASCTVTSSSLDPARFCLARLLPTGALDDTFDGPNATPGNGLFTLPVSLTSAAINDKFRSVAFDAKSGQQKMVVVGECGFYHCVAKINDDGSYDTTFTGPGAAASATGDAPSPSPGRDVFKHLSAFSETGSANAVVTQVTGKIIIVGTCTGSGGLTRTCLTKLNDDGSFDVDFNGTGTAPGVNPGRIVITSTSTAGFVYNERGIDVALQPNDDFLVLCAGYPPSGSSADRHCVYRFNSGGTLDTNLKADLSAPAVPGRVVWGSAGTTQAMAMANAPATGAIANRVVTLGSCNNGIQVGICIGVLQNKSGGQADGMLDTTIIGVNGNAAPTGFFRYAAWPYEGLTTGVEPRGVAVNNAGEFFVASSCDGEMCVYKFLANGTLDTSDCVADVNGDGNRSAPTDGVSLIRAMLNVPGTPGLPAGLGYDIDGNGALQAHIDGLLFIRRMLGLRDAALTTGITFGINATRTDTAEIQSYLDKRCGINP